MNCTLLFCLAITDKKNDIMAKVQLLAVLSIDGCLTELQSRKRLFRRLEDYGMEEIRENALYKLTPDYSVSILQEWREKSGNTCYLLEATAKNTEYANGLLRMNVIDEIILYIVPCIIGTGRHLFKSVLPETEWRIAESRKYDDGVMRLTYQRKKRN